MEVDISKLAGAVYGHKEIELAPGGPHLGNVDMEIADGVVFELAFEAVAVLDIGQPGDTVALQTTMQ